MDEEGNMLSPWKRWTEEKTPVREIAADGTIVEKQLFLCIVYKNTTQKGNKYTKF